MFQVAMKMKRLELVEETFAAEKDPLGKKQLAYILGQQASSQLTHASLRDIGKAGDTPVGEGGGGYDCMRHLCKPRLV